MRLYINKTDFISVLKQEDKYCCQPMTLRFGIDLYPATMNDDPTDAISVINGDSRICNSLEEVFAFHSSFI